MLRRWWTQRRTIGSLQKQVAMLQGVVNTLRARVDALEGSRKGDRVPATQLPARRDPPSSDGGQPKPVPDGPSLTDWKRGHWR